MSSEDLPPQDDPVFWLDWGVDAGYRRWSNAVKLPLETLRSLGRVLAREGRDAFELRAAELEVEHSWLERCDRR